MLYKMRSNVIFEKIDTYEINERYIIPFINSDIINNKLVMKYDRPFFEIGCLYTLEKEIYDNENTQTYKYLGHIESVKGINIDSILMQGIGDSTSTTFSLTREDCNSLGIIFDNNLQLFPQYIKWKKVDNEPPIDKEILLRSFNIDDLSTYPVIEKNDGMLYSMIIKISGFECLGNGLIKHGNNVFFHDIFLNNLKIKLKNTIGKSCDLSSPYFQKGSYIRFNYMTSKISRIDKNLSTIIDLDGCVFLELFFDSTIKNSQRQGIPLKNLEGKTFNELFDIFIIHNDCDVKVAKRSIYDQSLTDIPILMKYCKI